MFSSNNPRGLKKSRGRTQMQYFTQLTLHFSIPLRIGRVLHNAEDKVRRALSSVVVTVADSILY